MVVVTNESIGKGTSQAALMDLLDFRSEDLNANRAGVLSEMQDYRLRVRRRRAALVGAFALLAAVFIATGFIFTGNRSGSPILSIIGIAITICSTAVTGNILRFWLRLNADIQSGKVAYFTGKLERIVKPVNRSIVYYVIRVAEAEVTVSKEAFDYIVHGDTYTLYRAPHTGTLLSIEQVIA